jgi:hypothetical protein
MITRHHVALSIICTLILCSALVPADPVLIIVICAGACTGTLLPDIQMKRPQNVQIRTVAWMVTRFSRFCFTPLICWACQALTGRTLQPVDKRLTHSVPGIVSLWAVISGVLFFPAFVLMNSASWHLPAAFLCGVMLGMVLHLLEDMCTRKGIAPLFPFSTVRVSGSIRPCDTADRRIAQFHFYDCSIAGIILGFDLLGTWQGIASVPVCLFALGSCLGMMIWSSDVHISPDETGDRAAEINTPPPSDRTSVSNVQFQEI